MRESEAHGNIPAKTGVVIFITCCPGPMRNMVMPAKTPWSRRARMYG